MTEAEWLACTESLRMVKFIRSSRFGSLEKGVSDRKLRLFACACCRAVWDLLSEERRGRLDAVEGYADGSGQDKILVQGGDGWFYGDGLYPTDPVSAAAHCEARQAAFCAARDAAGVRAFTRPMHEAGTTKRPFYRVLTLRPKVRAVRDEHAVQSDLLRCILGNPFEPSPPLAARPLPLILTMARAIYDERCFEDLPILADALEDAGCDNTPLLSHLRDPGPHARGCWAVDRLLGKE
jgi:hypothetical protein